MIEAQTGTRRTTAQDGALPYRFVGLERFAVWRQAADAVVPFENGTPGDDTFVGTDAEDRFTGRRGNDTLSGGGGDDRLQGDGGDDRLDGGDGDDRLYGGTGNDRVSGGLGDDYIVSQDGRDRLYGNDGNDSIIADGGKSRLYGGAGNDSLSGGDSKYFGGAGNDYMTGGNCQMHGGAGDDRLIIFSAFDEIDWDAAWGGSGADTFAFAESGFLKDGTYVIHDLSNDDTVDLSDLDAVQSGSRNEAFRLVPEFDGRAGTMTVRYDAGQDATLVELHTDKDGIPDGTIVAPGNHADFLNFVF